MLNFGWRLLCSLICVLRYRADARRHAAVLTRLPAKYLRHYRTAVLHKWARRWLRMANVRVRVHGSTPTGRHGHLIVSNHQGYFDVVVLAAHRRGAFVTSTEVQQAFFMGEMADFGGSLFVNRQNPLTMRNDMRALRSTLEDGCDVYLFPEGTSSNGETVLPFKAALFAAAGRAVVQPAVIHYRRISGRPAVLQRRNRVAWYGAMTFPDHILLLLSQSGLEVDLTWLKLAPTTRTRDLANYCEKAIRYRYSSCQQKMKQAGKQTP